MSKPFPKPLVTFDLDACPDNLRTQLEACMLGSPEGAIVTLSPTLDASNRKIAQIEESRRAMSVLLCQWRDAYRQLLDAESEERGGLAPIDTVPASLRKHLDDLDRATAQGYPLP
ncbi:hypothetical protein [Halomonas sp. C05BenzN]|uniref:hypothetical protein n=1 Tax=Halomonas sp. C05BenzN TaxID=3411041 RepID=UPI003B955871